MYYLLRIFFSPKSGGAIILRWRVLCGTRGLLEEIEHLLFALLRGTMLFLVSSAMERGITKWISTALIIIFLFFSVRAPFWVYVFLEISLFPVLVLIIGWGVQPERISAGYHLLVYTLIFSSPLFVGVLFLERKTRLGLFLWGFWMGFALIVKTPIYLVHVWLPKAHVEAPTRGSIILAGILLKIGGIGLIWLQNFCFLPWSLFFFLCVFFGGAGAALIRGFQRDGKALVAYRRVAHINLRILVVMFFSSLGDRRRRVLIFNHGFVRRGLFLLVGISFHFLRSRLVYFFFLIFLFKRRGLLIISWVLTCNFSVPPSLGLFGEVRALSLSLRVFWGLLRVFCLYFLFVAYYSLLLNLSLVGKANRPLRAINRIIIWSFIGLRLRDWCFWGFF